MPRRPTTTSPTGRSRSTLEATPCLMILMTMDNKQDNNEQQKTHYYQKGSAPAAAAAAISILLSVATGHNVLKTVWELSLF